MSKSFPIRFHVLAAGFLLVSVPDGNGSLAAQRGAIQFALEAQYDDNIGLSERRADRQQDFITSFSGIVRREIATGRRSAVVLRADAKYHEFIDFSDLSRRELGAELRWYFQPRPGFTQPWVSLFTGLSVRRHGDSALRDGSVVRLGATTGRRFTDRLSGRLGYDYSNRGARRGQVFDIEQHRLFSNMDLRLPGGVSLYGNYSLTQGDVVSVARPNAVVSGAADALAPDTVFGVAGGHAGPGPGPMGPGQQGFVAYQLDATVRRVELGMNLPLDAVTALDFSVARLSATATSSIDYNGLQLRAGVLRRF